MKWLWNPKKSKNSEGLGLKDLKRTDIILVEIRKNKPTYCWVGNNIPEEKKIHLFIDYNIKNHESNENHVYKYNDRCFENFKVLNDIGDGNLSSVKRIKVNENEEISDEDIILDMEKYIDNLISKDTPDSYAKAAKLRDAIKVLKQ